jgi:hypothetical protein
MVVWFEIKKWNKRRTLSKIVFSFGSVEMEYAAT